MDFVLGLGYDCMLGLGMFTGQISCRPDDMVVTTAAFNCYKPESTGLV